MIDYRMRISESGQSIYDEFTSTADSLYIPSDILERMLADGLVGLNLEGAALRTRSKVVKTKICEVLGYHVPKSFKKTQPRFLSQNFDIYIQKRMNVQIWNEEIVPQRRYVFIRVDEDDTIANIKIINGDQLAELDRTGTLTSKYQATMRNLGDSYLLSSDDTKRVSRWCDLNADLRGIRPNSAPAEGEILPIREVFERVSPLEGEVLPHLGYLQERNRAAKLHQIICNMLGFSSYEDDGTYPDILNQLIEIKLQTSPTIDLGLHHPDDRESLFEVRGQVFRSRDVRYIIADGFVDGDNVVIRYVHVVNGRDFSTHFPLFGGKVRNAKLQMLLPPNFFND